ncbi:cytochrome c oxidase assembly protein [Schumannella soli]|uniref:Cytochrome c oxidase assembly protein n=1 Tax=Schumannella soli TaxID=2590779 RepID=A0A506Y8E3_9MICO|nr:cytochrome c oxidase assembly protein [Schumannella soli]
MIGVARVARAGGRWPLHSTALFVAVGLGSFAAVSFGVLGVLSADLRWAFTTRVALLLVVVPAAIAAGRPLALLRAASGERGRARLDRVLASRVVRLFGNAMFATLSSAAVFTLFLTPLAGIARTSPATEDALTVVVPMLGLLMVLPIAEDAAARTSLFITVEFLLAFVELIIDAIPGIVLRITPAVLDQVPRAAALASWWPSPLRDQQLAGDLLWFIAEVADVPILIVLGIRWARSDRREARSYDELSDEELAELTRQHLHGPRAAPDR